MKYHITVNDVQITSCETKNYTGWEEKYYKSVFLEDTYLVSKGSKITFHMKLAKNLDNRDTLHTFSGNDGYSFADVENTHKGLFKIESSGEDSNGTSQGNGQIPGILYNLD
jgi:hypothetical protein